MMVRFTKMHGNGNDFILVDEFEGVVVEEERKPEFVRAVCHRYFGIGADGMLFVQKSDVADVRFRYFNSDGSEAEMCGNGIRCFSRYVVEEGYAESPLKVETLAGILELEVTRDDEGWWVRVDMGRPRLGKEEIPALEEVWGKEFEFDGRRFRVYALNTGVPHAVIFVDDLDFDIIPAAKHIRHHPVFPEGINVNFAKVLDAKTVRVRTYERGVENETLSCGTGSVAVAVVANRLGLTGRSVDVLTKGGKLKIEIADDTVYMTGQASRVADGYINTEELRYDLP
ncbi:MAG: diaminopimelate epimerase [Archaeoglobi archaeon]|nr:diaminopimelate epimerase [Archaeoglobi archaeon]